MPELKLENLAFDLTRILKDVKEAFAKETNTLGLIGPSESLRRLRRSIGQSVFMQPINDQRARGPDSEAIGLHALLTVFGRRPDLHTVFVGCYVEYVRIRLTLQLPRHPEDLIPLARAHGRTISHTLVNDILEWQRTTLIKVLEYIAALDAQTPIVLQAGENVTAICLNMFK
jgi:hypothetical protein